MARRVGRPSKPWCPTHYSPVEIEFIYQLVKKTDNIELKVKLKHNIAESKRLAKNYKNAKLRLFGND